MNRNFSRAREILTKRLEGSTNWQFLSISFDPGFDQPSVLAQHALSHRGPNADRWLFAVASTHTISEMAANLGFRFATDGGSFVHNLRTVVLGPQGQICRQFDGNKWKAEELAAALSDAARKTQ